MPTPTPELFALYRRHWTVTEHRAEEAVDRHIKELMILDAEVDGDLLGIDAHGGGVAGRTLRTRHIRYEHRCQPTQ